MSRVKPFSLKAARHHYFVEQVYWFISMVLSATVSLRGSSEVMEITVELLGLEADVPYWTSGRMWLMRLGYDKLERAKEKGDDWVWIVDPMVVIGEQKCLLIFGSRLSELEFLDGALKHEDVEPIAVLPVRHSDGDVVFQQLEEGVKKTGVPRSIIGDQGSDLKKGVEKFCEKHPETSYIYDIKHKTANLLKKELGPEAEWKEYLRLCSETRSKVQQTRLAYLMPPEQRAKGRYMNVYQQIEWGIKALDVIENARAKGVKVKEAPEIEKKLGWLRGYRENLKEWRQLIEVTNQGEEFIRANGLYRGCEKDLAKQLAGTGEGERAKKLKQELERFVEGESKKAKEGEVLLGSSEVIESVIGKIKYVGGEQGKKGLTGMILSAAAMVSKTTEDVVKTALESVKTKDILKWRKKHLGQTMQAKRLKVFGRREKKGTKVASIEDASPA